MGNSEQICVVGLGYIGLPTALVLAEAGNQVVGVDINQELVDTLRRGKTTFQEEGLTELFAAALANGIRFETICPVAPLYILAVPTPFDQITKKIDPSFVVKAVESVLDVCKQGAILVIESTISPGTVEKYIRPAIISRGYQPGLDVHLVHAPERIIPGDMIRELRYNARIIGADDRQIGETVKAIYAGFCENEIVVTDIKTAEMTKVVENTFRDVNIAFANELAKICRQDELDVYEIIRIANMHPRVNILQPGPGVGGHCISVDPWFLVGDYPELSLLIHEARKVNDSMPDYVLRRVRWIMDEHGLTDISRIGFYGITYKEDVDDTRESPTLQIYEAMRERLGVMGIVKYYDPLCAPGMLEGQMDDFDAFVEQCDLVVIMVGHAHIRQNIDKIRGKVILDTRNICPFPECYQI